MHLAGAGGWRLASTGLIAGGLVGFLLHGSASAELTQKQDKDWAGIAGAWWLNEKCHFLDEAKKSEFEWTVAQLTSAISKDVGTKRALLRIKIAEDVAKEKSCDDSSREIVTWAVGASRKLNRELGGEDYVAGASDLQYDLQRLEAVAAAVGIEERCKFGPQDGRTFFVALYESLLPPMSAATHDDKLPFRTDVVRTLSRENKKPSCTDDAHSLVLLAVGEAKSLGTKYRVWSPEKGLLQ
jgi:hypothetical protein